MQKLSVVLVLCLGLLLVACGAESPAGGGEGGPTATAVVLVTPTPLPAPPTPTSRPAPEEDTAAADSETDDSTPNIPEDMVLIPAGTYTIGSDESTRAKNTPAHEVEVAAFEIDRFEVTNAEFARFADEVGYTTYAEDNNSRSWRDEATDKGNHPVVYVTWDDAAAYCEWAGKRLPTEQEWEVAARGEDGRIYPWGDAFPDADNIASFANVYETRLRGTFPVGGFAEGVSPFEVFDMAGNVSEWTSSSFLPYPGTADDADDFFSEDNKVHRGGGWFDGAELVTTFNRNAGPPSVSASDVIGFRCARDASE